MTPEEANLIKELFNRLYTLEKNQRDPEADGLIQEGLQYAPNAPYALVQTVLVQDEALKRANARIQELEGGAGAGAPPRDTSFLGGMRDSLLGRRGSVPSVPPGGAGTGGGMSPAWQQTGAPPPPSGAPSGPWPAQPPAQPAMPAPGTGGSSFLGTAAAAAAGVIGGSLLLGGIRSMMGGGHGSAHAAYDPSGGGGSPWSGGGGSAAGGELSRQAGLDDIGGSPRQSFSEAGGGGGDGQGDFTDDGQGADEDLDDGGFDSDGGGDFGGGDEE
jgi:uncharacterized protein